MHRKHSPKWTTLTHKIDIRKVQTVEVSQIPFSDFNRIKFKISSKKLPNMYTPPSNIRKVHSFQYYYRKEGDKELICHLKDGKGIN